MTLTKIAMLFSFFASSAAFAQVAAPTPGAAGATAVAPAPVLAPDKKICRSQVPLGSIMSKRICHTRSEWAAIRASDNAAAANALDQAHRGSGGLNQGAN